VPPKLTTLINLRDTHGDQFFISRLDRASGSRAYLLSVKTTFGDGERYSERGNEIRGSIFLEPEDLQRIMRAIASELGGHECHS
jgi:hypothetical protein